MASIQNSRFDPQDAEHLLASLEGIISAHIVSDARGRMTEIHVLATPELHPKQVVRNIESALSAGLGIHVDRRIVSVAQIRGESNDGTVREAQPVVVADLLEESEVEAEAGEEPEGLPRESGQVSASDRLEYVGYESRRALDRCECTVVLRGTGGDAAGRGAGPDTTEGRAEAGARAVIDAIMRARPGLRLRLEGAVITGAHNRRFVIVSARALLDRTTVPLAGAALLAHSPEEAGILASLQAANRSTG